MSAHAPDADSGNHEARDPVADPSPRATAPRDRAFFDLVPDGVLIADPQGRYLDANPAICAMLGYARDELVGLHASDIVTPEELGNIEPAIEAIRSGPGYQREWRFRRRDGTTFPADVIATPLPDGNMLAMVRDISVQRAREAELRRMTRLYAALSHVNQSIVLARSREDLFDRICHALVDEDCFRMAWVGWHDPLTHRLDPVAVAGDDSGYVRDIEVYVDDRPQGSGPSGLAFRTARPCIANRLLEDPSARPWRAQAERRGLRASAVFPIRCDGVVRGTLSVYSLEADFFRDKEIALLEEAAGDISYALDNLARDGERRAAEAAARAEKLFSDTMIDSMPGVVYFYDARGRFLRWNHNFETVSEHSGEEIARMHPLDFFAEQDRERVAAAIAEVFAAGRSSIEVDFIAKGGSATPYLFTGRRVSYLGEDCLVGVGIDVSERRRAQQELEQSERNYRELVETANSVILRWNADGTITFLNGFGQRFFGYAADEIVGRNVIGTIVPETESSGRDLRALMQAIQADPEAFRENINENMRRDGARVWIAWTNRVVRDADGRIVELLAIGSDITGLKRTEAALRDSELRFHTLFEQTPVGVIVIDSANGRIVECNQQAAHQLGFTPGQLERLRVADIASSLPGTDTAETLARIVAQGRDEFEMHYRTPEGSVRDVLVNARVLELGGRRAIHCVFLDITARKRAERVLREANQRLEASVAERTRELQAALVRAEAADRLKSAFLATMSHELRTPLNSIIGFTGILLQGLAGELNDEQRRQLGMVRSSGRHLLELISDVLDVSKIEAGQMQVRTEPFDLRAVAERAVGSVRPLAKKKGLALDLAVEPGPATIASDRRRVEQVLLNLLNNAIKFTESGGVKVSIDWPEASLAGAAPVPCTRIRVADTGIGIRESDLGRLFEPFHQLDSGLTRQHEGTGLGLAICRRLCDLLGGTITVSSAWMRGSTFVVTLPRQRASRP